MAIINRKLDEKTQIEEVWYQSSNLYYSKVDFSKSTKKIITEAPGISFEVPTVDVLVVFNRGARYLYKDVEIHDYHSFINVLNREDGSSHGKAFNKFLKPYPFEKLEDIDIKELKY